MAVIYDPALIWPSILRDIANGSSLASALRKPGMPSYQWAKMQLRNDSELHKHYEQAVVDRADYLAEEMLELADTPPPKDLEGPALNAWVQQLKLRIDARKWGAARMNRARWGDQLQVQMDTSYTISITAALEEASKRVVNMDRIVDI